MTKLDLLLNTVAADMATDRWMGTKSSVEVLLEDSGIDFKDEWWAENLRDSIVYATKRLKRYLGVE